jgi:hypothetical protein
MNLYTTSRARTGSTAANADAFRVRAQKRRADSAPAESDRRGGARAERVRARDKDRYDPGAAAYVARAQMQKAPDQQRYTPHPRAERNHQAEPRRSGRA